MNIAGVNIVVDWDAWRSLLYLIQWIVVFFFFRRGFLWLEIIFRHCFQRLRMLYRFSLWVLGLDRDD